MKKILLITAFPPNDRTAGQYYTKRLVLDLIDTGNLVSIIYFSFPNHSVVEEIQDTVLFSEKPSLINCLNNITFYPLFTKRFNLSILKKINNISKDYNILYFDYSQIFIYAKYIHHSCKIFMCHDIIFQKVIRKNFLLGLWVKHNEKNLLKNAHQIFTFSKKDNLLITQNYGMDAKNINFYLRNSAFKYETSFEISKSQFCFFGAWNRPENNQGLLWFINNVLPSVDEKKTFVIIGSGLNLHKKILEHPQIKYLGFVDDPLKILAASQALIAPIFSGAGVKVKVIDSLSCGTSIIGTDIAFEGITNISNLLHTANTKNDFIKSINNFCIQTKEQKEEAMNKFISFYNKNHFPEYLEKIEKLYFHQL